MIAGRSGYDARMPDSDRDEITDSMHAADARNGEPDALDSERIDPVDDDPGQRLQPGDEVDATARTSEGEPIHHVTGGDIGDGGD